MLEDSNKSEPTKSHEEKPDSLPISAAEIRFAAHQLLGGNIPDWHERAQLPSLNNLQHKDQLPWFGMQMISERMKELELRLSKLESSVSTESSTHSKGKK